MVTINHASYGKHYLTLTTLKLATNEPTCLYLRTMCGLAPQADDWLANGPSRHRLPGPDEDGIHSQSYIPPKNYLSK